MLNRSEKLLPTCFAPNFKNEGHIALGSSVRVACVHPSLCHSFMPTVTFEPVTLES